MFYFSHAITNFVENGTLAISQNFADPFIGFAASVAKRAEINSTTRRNVASSSKLLEQVQTASNER